MIEAAINFLEDFGRTEFLTIFTAWLTALLVILIPFAIAVFQEIYRKKNTKTEGYAELDLNIILDYIVNYPRFLLFVSLAFFAIVVWGFIPPVFRVILLIPMVMGLIYQYKMMWNIYKWVKGSISEFRLKYLRGLKKEEEIANAWKTVWSNKSPTPEFERELFSIFAQKIDEKIVNNRKKHNFEKLEKTIEMLRNFNENISYRSDDLFSPIEIQKVLNWLYKAWKHDNELFSKIRDTQLSSKVDDRLWWEYSRLRSELEKTFKLITSRIIKNKSIGTFLIISLNKHANNNKSNKDYLQFLFQLFFKEIFQCAPIDYDLWCILPDERKITKQNLENKNPISNVAWQKYLNFTRSRLCSQDAFDKALEDITRNLFPEVDPVLWAILVHFNFYGKDWNAVELLIEKGWRFGYVPKSEFEDSHEEQKLKWTEATFELYDFLFPNTSVEDIKNFAKQLNEKKYDDNGKESRRRILLELFNQWLSYLKKRHH